MMITETDLDLPLDQAAIFAALAYHYPEGFTAFDPAASSPSTYEEYVTWTQGDTLSIEQMLHGARETFARRALNAEIRAQRAALRETWSGLPAFIRGPFHDQFESANRLLDARDYDAAVALIKYAMPPSDYDTRELQTYHAVHAQLVAALDGIRTLAMTGDQ